MGAKTTTFSTSLLQLIFNGTAYAGVAINATTAPFVNLWCSLHTTTPAVGSAQNVGEAAYLGYTRMPITRTSAGWTIAGNSVNPAATITFAAATAGTTAETESFFGVGVSPSGAGGLLYFGTISPVIAVATGVTPQLTGGSSISET